MKDTTWKTPLLVELVRGRPEEAILVACKTGESTVGIIAPQTAALGCTSLGTPVGLSGENGCAKCELHPSS